MVLDRAVMRIFSERHGDDADSPDRAGRQQGRRRQVGRDRDSAGRRDPDPAHAQARRLDARAGGDRRQGGDLGGRRRDRRLHRVGIPGDAPAGGGVRARLPGRPFLLPVVRRADGAQRAPAGVARRRRAGAGFARGRAPPADAGRGRRHARHQLSGGGRAAAVRGARGGAGDRIRAVGARVLRRDLAALGALPRRGIPRRVTRVARAARAGAPSPREGPRRSRPSARAGGGDGRLGDREHRGHRRARRSRQLRAGPRPRQPDRARAGAGRRAGHPGPPGADALAPGRRCGRADAAAGAGRFRGRAGRAGRRRGGQAGVRLRRPAPAPRRVRLHPAGPRRGAHVAGARRRLRHRAQDVRPRQPRRRHDHPPRRTGGRGGGRHRGAGRLAGAGVGGAARTLRRRSRAPASGLRAALAGPAVSGGAAARPGDRTAQEPSRRPRDGASPVFFLQRAPRGPDGPERGGRG